MSGSSRDNSGSRRDADDLHILYFAPQTGSSLTRTGIQRVVVEMAKALLGRATLEFVKWDSEEGQLRYFNVRDLELFFQTKSFGHSIGVNKFAERSNYRFGDTIPDEARTRTWLVMPEIPYHAPDGADIFNKVVCQAREYGIRTAAIFYDLIPLTNPDYSQGEAGYHDRYVRELLRCDLLLAISQYSADDLRRYYATELGLPEAMRARAGLGIEAVLLAGGNDVKSRSGLAAAGSDRNLIVLLGTVEPRKQQNQVIKAFQKLQIARRYGLRLAIVGSLHPLVAQEFNALTRDDDAIDYYGYASEAKLSDLFQAARFSVFASNDEGFGLPICESLIRGVPCLTADFGAMREVADGGGCLMVDVNSAAALEKGLLALSSDDAAVEALRQEIQARRFRTWADHATEAVAHMRAACDRSATLDAKAAIGAAIADAKAADAEAGCVRVTVRNQTWIVLCCRSIAGPDILKRLADGTDDANALLAIIFIGDAPAFQHAGDDVLRRVLGADAWIFEHDDVYRRLVTFGFTRRSQGMLPACCASSTGGEHLDELAVRTLDAHMSRRERRHRIALQERLLRSVRHPRKGLTRAPVLTIMISTYNREAFVGENVTWILKLIEPYQGQVTLTVVDNTSTDDTVARLSQFRGHPLFTLWENTANVGMLGNLHVCSTLPTARHTWIVGDDDFIAADVLDGLLEGLSADPYIPFAIVNFAVYYREKWLPGDTVETLTSNPVLLASDPSPHGIYKIKDIAGEHDNLFTAIYPIVFRSDILSACFNYPFSGRPFGSLVESIPTTKLILESYGDVDALWIDKIGVVGNAHNSWRHYRVPWHGVLMASALSLELIPPSHTRHV